MDYEQRVYVVIALDDNIIRQENVAIDIALRQRLILGVFAIVWNSDIGVWMESANEIMITIGSRNHSS
jgi:hypothetical protein